MKVHEQHKNKGPTILKFALVVVSTSRHEELKTNKETSDKTIPLVKKILVDHANISLESTKIVSDSAPQIKDALKNLLNDMTIHAIIFSGGTGLSPKDITYETINPLIEKKVDGFGEFFRYLSFKEIGPAAMLSRAVAGKIKDKIVYLLPGSTKAVELALKELIIPETGHIYYIINKEE